MIDSNDWFAQNAPDAAPQAQPQAAKPAPVATPAPSTAPTASGDWFADNAPGKPPSTTQAPPAQQPAKPQAVQPAQPKDTGVWAGVKRNTVGAVEGIYHALSDPVTPEESAQLLQKIQDHNARPDVKMGALPSIPEQSAQNPSKVALAYHRIIDAPADVLLKKGKDETEAAKDLLTHHEYWKGGNLYMSGLADKLLSAVPLVGPTVNSIAERAEGGDVSGAATDVAAALLAEHLAPKVLSGTAKTIGATLEKVAPESMNTLLRANKQANYLYGKNPGKAFIDEGIKIPKDSITLGGQLENLHGQLEIAQDNLSSQLKAALSDPAVAAEKIDIVPTVTDAVADAKKFISKQTGLDVPKYTAELNKLEDSILTRYDSEGNPTGKITGTKLSPAEVADVKKSLGKNTQWRVLPTDPEIQLKTYLNGVRKRIYGQLADTVEQAAPDANVKELNQRLANSIEAQGLLEKRIAYEHGTGGYAAAARKAELIGGLLTAIVSPEPVTKTLGAGAVVDRAVRSVPGKMVTAKAANAVGKSLQSGAGQTAAQAAGVAAMGEPVAAQLPNQENE
jgi:hypothetical protein